MANPLGGPAILRGPPIGGIGMPSMPPMAGGFPMMNPLGAMNPLANSVPILDRNDILKDKEVHLTKDAQMVKRMLFHILKSDIQ
jgi:hypothetical protein